MLGRKFDDEIAEPTLGFVEAMRLEKYAEEGSSDDEEIWDYEDISSDEKIRERRG
jgi:hypothetical protein